MRKPRAKKDTRLWRYDMGTDERVVVTQEWVDLATLRMAQMAVVRQNIHELTAPGNLSRVNV